MTIDPNKYIVFKREDFDRWADTIHDADSESMPEALPDAVVIRRKDVFAAPALYAYASTCVSVADVLDITDGQPSMIAGLRDLADFFAGEADAARQTNSKVPTP